MELNNINNKGAWSEIAAALNQNFLKILAELLKYQHVTTISGANFLGYFTSSSVLPNPAEAAWAVAGDLKAVTVYAYYTSDAVPNGFSVGWNALSSLGTYDFTDYSNLLTKVEETDAKVSELGLFQKNSSYIRAYVDSEGKFLWGIKTDGSIEWAKGVPTPVKEYITSIVYPYFDNNNRIIAQYLDEISNREYIRAYVDSEGKFLWGIKTDGSIEWAKGVPTPVKEYVENRLFDNNEEIDRINKAISYLLELTETLTETYSFISNTTWIYAIIDKEERVLFGIQADGSISIPNRDLFESFQDAEGRMELTIDSENKVLSYRDRNGTKHEMKMAVEKSLILGKEALSDLQKALIAGGYNTETPVDWSNQSEITLPIPRYCAKVNIISESGLSSQKLQNKRCVLQFWDKSGNYFKKFIILNAQGSSSMAYIEKNQSIDVYNDESYEDSCNITFGNWVAQDSFHLKCYYIDVFRGLANVGYNYCEEIIQYLRCRNNRVKLDNTLINKDNSTGNFDIDFGDGALCHPDGFPFEMYVNGEYYGLFAWNLKKHRKNYSMNKKDYTSTLLDGVIDEVTFFNKTIDWTQFELRNPKDLVTMDGREYDADTNCNELIDETSIYYNSSDATHVNTAIIKKIVQRQSQAIPTINAEADEESARTLYEQYYDVTAMLCYFIVSNVTYNYDGFRKNWIWTIYDRISAPTFYDMDSLFGRHWSGTSVVENATTTILGTSLSLPTGQLVRLYKNELIDLYKDLRDNNLISVPNIMRHVESWVNRVGLIAYKKNLEVWTSIPSYRKRRTVEDGSYTDGGIYDSPKRIEAWLEERISYLDRYFNYNV